MYYRYKGHVFSIDSKPLPDGGGWTFVAEIYWFNGRQEEFVRFGSTDTFAVPEEAQMGGIAVIRKWIDAGKPEITEQKGQLLRENQ
jgi:hypothetical protein